MATTGVDIMKPRNAAGQNSLFLAAEYGCLKMLLWIVSSVPTLDLHATDNEGRTPLIKATQNGHYEAVLLLVEAGVSPVAAMYDGSIPMLAAASVGNLRLVHYLAQFESLNYVNNLGQTALHCAAATGNLVVVQWLCGQSSVDVGLKNADGFTAQDLAQQATQR